MIKEPLLKIDNLQVRFSPKQMPSFDAVKGISFELYQGETLAIVGESGSGKSISALSILQLLPYPVASHPSGSILFKGKQVMGMPESDLRSLRGAQIAMIFQEPMTALNPLHTIGRQITEAMLVHGRIKPSQAEAEAIRLLKEVGFDDPESRIHCYPHQLSGGQRQRAMIAMAISCSPDILIADEPTTALDVTIQAGILKLLKRLQKQYNMAMLFISHDLGIVKKMADRIAVMRHGLIVEEANVTDLFKNPQHAYTQKLLNSEPNGMMTPLSTEKSSQEPLFFGRNMCVNYINDSGLFKKKKIINAVQDVSINLRQGETVGIVGESGSGKSSLAYALLRLIKSEGHISYNGTDLQSLKSKQIIPYRKSLQIIFQDPFSSLNPRFTIHQIIAEGLIVHYQGLSTEQINQKVLDVLEQVGLDAETRFRYPHEFSGGQRQRISIARALILEPSILVLDEPTSALDRSIQSDILNLLKKLQKDRNLSYLFISHDLKLIKMISHRVMVMKDGKVVESGLTKDIFDNPQTDYTKRLLKAALEVIPDDSFWTKA